MPVLSTTASTSADPSSAALPLLIFGEDWGRHPSTAQYLATELLSYRHITWINSIGLREPTLSAADLGRIVGKLQRAAGIGSAENKAPASEPGNSPIEETAIRAPQRLVSPWIVPFHRQGWAQRLNASLFRRQIGKFADLTPGSYNVITANPASFYLLDTLAPARSLYYCADKYAQIAGLNPQLVDRFERQLLERVDTVVATSQPLADELAQHHNAVHYLPHGVDFARFNSTLQVPGNTTTPTVGFIGLLGEHINFDLIASAAAALPTCKFLFVGPVEQGAPLPQADNLHYVGSVPQANLPGYLAQMDVCTLPYANSERNHYANPTKVREYLAAGRAVVATRQPGLLDIEGEVDIADSTDDYIAALRQRLEDLVTLDADALAALREAISAPMQQETWQHRAERLAELV